MIHQKLIEMFAYVSYYYFIVAYIRRKFYLLFFYETIKIDMFNMHSRIILLLFFVFSPIFIRGQSFVIKGSVFGGTKQEPLPFASVFLSGTTKGTITDSNGNFLLDNLPAGQFDLIVSFLGYTTLKLKIQTMQNKHYKFILRPVEKQLDAVTVTATANRRRTGYSNEMLAIFINNFIGQTPNSKLCRLQNVNNLDFIETDSSMVVTATQPLIIDNLALGYRLTYHLEQFFYNYKQQRISYQGQPFYEDLPAKDEKQAEFWKSNRLEAYKGSLMHFMRSLYKRKLVEEGFAIQQAVERVNRLGNYYFFCFSTDSTAKYISPNSNQKYIQLPNIPYSNILDTLKSENSAPIIKFNNWIQVTYALKKEPLIYQRTKEIPTNRYGLVLQHSYIRLLGPGLALEPDGRFDLQGMLFQGYWTWELLGDSLPTDYWPE